MTDDKVLIDDRSVQDLVDEAKRLIPWLCPEWTNHGPTDPGIALIEVFAGMTVELIQRLNDIPARVHEAFVRLVGIEPFPASAASVDVLAMTATDDFEPPLHIPQGAVFATTERADEQAVSFEAVRDLLLWPADLATWGTLDAGGGRFVERASAPPSPDASGLSSSDTDHALVLGLSRGCADHVLRVEIDASADGLGADPNESALVWEASSSHPEGWRAVEVLSDTTRGLSRSGAVVVVVPSEHESVPIGSYTASWLRARRRDVTPGPMTTEAVPHVRSVSVTTVGGSVRATHAATVSGELLGISDGTPGQIFRTSKSPLLAGTGHVLATDGGQTTEWHPVANFSESGPNDRHFTVEAASGTIRFGPAVRHADGAQTQRGAVLPPGAELRLSTYRVGGGAIGNVGPDTVLVLRTTVPSIAQVRNPRPALGGADPEDVESWRTRSRLALQTGERAVTAADFERIALWAHPLVGRARCVEVPACPVRVLLVPYVWSSDTLITLKDVTVSDEVLKAVAGQIDACRVVGTAVEITTPSFTGVSVVARVRAQTYSSAAVVRQRCLDAVATLLHPTRGGTAGTGWPFGRDVDELALASVLNAVDGVEEVVEVLVFDADPVTGERSGAGRRRRAVAVDSLPLLVAPQVVLDRPG